MVNTHIPHQKNVCSSGEEQHIGRVKNLNIKKWCCIPQLYQLSSGLPLRMVANFVQPDVQQYQSKIAQKAILQ